MLEQAHLEGTSTDTDFQQSEHQLPSSCFLCLWNMAFDE